MSGIENEKKEKRITSSGNPRKPQGEDGKEMLLRMNESHSPVTGWALGLWEISESDRILDIGCGGGGALHRMAEQVVSGHLTGVDYSEVSVAVSRKTNREAVAAGKMDVQAGTVEALPFDTGTFDKIITVESFYFWPDPAENLKEVLRVLKPGGTFLLVADIYEKADLSEKNRDNIRQYDLFNPTLEELQDLLERAGFAHVRIHTNPGTDWVCGEGRK